MAQITHEKPKEKPERAGISLQQKRVIWAYIFLAIPIIFFLYIRIYPTVNAFRLSLYDYNPLRIAEDNELVWGENYLEIWEDLQDERSPTRKAFENTGWYILIGMPLQLVLALFIALMLNEIKFLSNLFRVVFFLPFVTSTIAISWVFRWLYQPQGLVNDFLGFFTIPAQPFLRHPDQALYSITAVVIWQGLGFAIIIFLAGLKQIPRMYYEAAQIDGATRWNAFWRITFPLLNPSIVYLVVLQSISFLRMFAPVIAMTDQGRGGPLNATTTVVLRVYREAFQGNNYGYAAALTVVLFLIIMIVTVVQLRVTSRRTD